MALNNLCLFIRYKYMYQIGWHQSAFVHFATQIDHFKDNTSSFVTTINATQKEMKINDSLILQSVIEFCKTHKFTHFLEENLDENTTGGSCVVFIQLYVL